MKESTVAEAQYSVEQLMHEERGTMSECASICTLTVCMVPNMHTELYVCKLYLCD